MIKVFNMDHQKGISLIEVLVSMTLFSFGIMGMSQIQTIALTQVDDSRQSLLAAWKVQDLADRIRATRTLDNPGGMADLYMAAIGGDLSEIGSDKASQVFSCSNLTPPSNAEICARQTSKNGSTKDAQVCTDQQLVDYDIWETLCDTNTGLATDAGDATGSLSLQDLQIVMTSVDNTVVNPVTGSSIDTKEYVIYMEWVSGSADKNNSQLNAISTNLCGSSIMVDPKLSVHCLRFR